MNAVPSTPAPSPAGQRLLLINGVTWAVIVLFLGYGVFTQQTPPPSFMGRNDSTAGSFLRVPGPTAPAPTQSVSDGNAPPSFGVHGMAGFSPRQAPPATKPDAEKKHGDKATPGKDEKKPADQPPQRFRFGGFAPVTPPKE
jgi:hypothetical protein